MIRGSDRLRATQQVHFRKTHFKAPSSVYKNENKYYAQLFIFFEFFITVSKSRPKIGPKFKMDDFYKNGNILFLNQFSGYTRFSSILNRLNQIE